MSEPTPEPAQVYLKLRDRILRLNPAALGLTPTREISHVWGVVMETGYEVGSATLVALADGTTSLYYSTGGGMLGSGTNSPLAQASKALIAQAEAHISEMSSSTDFPLPEVGEVQFIILTYAGIFSAFASREALAAGNHSLTPLFIEARHTLSQLRLSAEKKRK